MSEESPAAGGVKELVIVTGLSGAGKSTALRALEDLGWFTVDGLPAAVAPEMADFMRRESMRHFQGMAIGMDLRQDDFLAQFNTSMNELAKRFPNARVMFLEATTDDLMRRYAATRRPHPLERRGLALDSAIAEERSALLPVREKAWLVIDSSGFSIHDLRREIQRHFLRKSGQTSPMRVNLVSFGFKYGLPADADFIFDLRFLVNPYFVEKLRALSGKDKDVAEYIFSNPVAAEFRQKLLDLLLFTLARMEEEGRYRVTIGLGCTGGRHRSVALAIDIGEALRQSGYPVSIEHRHLDNDVSNGKCS